MIILVYFLILAFIIFLIVKGMNSLARKQIAALFIPPVPTKEEILLTENPELLKQIAVK